MGLATACCLACVLCFGALLLLLRCSHSEPSWPDANGVRMKASRLHPVTFTGRYFRFSLATFFCACCSFVHSCVSGQPVTSTAVLAWLIVVVQILLHSGKNASHHCCLPPYLSGTVRCNRNILSRYLSRVSCCVEEVGPASFSPGHFYGCIMFFFVCVRVRFGPLSSSPRSSSSCREGRARPRA